jgi:hypothetical protein
VLVLGVGQLFRYIFAKNAWSECIKQSSYKFDCPPVSSPELLCLFQSNLKPSIFRHIFSKSVLHYIQDMIK